MAEHTFDTPGYVARMGLLIDKAYLEYRHLATDACKLQALYIRTYLWISSLLATFEIGAINQFKTGKLVIAQAVAVPFWMLAGSSLLLAVVTFALCIDLMRGRRNLEMPLGDFKYLADKAYAEAYGDKTALFHQTVLVSLGAEINRQAATTHQRGTRLRSMSWLLLCSALMAVLAALFYFVA